MSKHDCHIDTTGKTEGVVRREGEDWCYFSHRIIASHEDGFIHGRVRWSNAAKKACLGHLYENDGGRKNAPQWWWELHCFEPGGRRRMSRQRFHLKKEAIASLSKALGLRGYRLVAGD